MRVEFRYPINEQIVKVVTYDDGDIAGWKKVIEIASHGLLVMGTTTVASSFDPIFATIWMLTAATVFCLIPSLRFRLFARHPLNDSVSNEGCDVPPDLLDRYEHMAKEFKAIYAELDALPLKGSR